MPDDDHTFHKEVKRALAHLHDPVYLSTCPLTSLAPPDLSLLQAKQAGALQRLLRQAVEHLRPSGEPSHDDRQWRPYLVLYHRYVEGLSRKKVMDRLVISAATLKRAQQRAIAAMCEFLREWEGELYPLPVNAELIPRIERFVGRQEELGRYRRHLQEEGFVILSGMAGVGKTALAAELVSRWQEGSKVVWFCFRQGRNTDIAAVLEGLAFSLAALGQDEYWRFLQMDRQKENSLSRNTRIRYLINVLVAGNYIVCFDNFEVAGDDAAINSLLRDMLKSARLGQLRLLVMSRVMPIFATGYPIHSLNGLCQQDARCLLVGAGLPRLPESIFDQLYDKTDGTPVFLKLFAAWVHSQGLLNMDDNGDRGQIETFVSHLVRQRDVRHYLLREMYDTLQPVEQHFLEIGSAFRLRFEERAQGIARLLTAEGVENVERALNDLVDSHLLTSDGAGHFFLHPLIQEYCYSRLAARPADKARVHGRLAVYYEEENDPLEAAYHYDQAGEHHCAIILLADNYRRLVAAGQAQAALKQLEQLAPHLVGLTDKVLRFDVAVAREKFCYLLGLRDEQRTTLSAMRDMAEELGDAWRLAMTYNHQARFYQSIGEFDEAIASAEAGQAAARRAGDKVVEADSFHRWGVALCLRGDYAAARERSEQALALAQETNDQQRTASVLRNLGNICYRLSDLAAARGFYQQAMDIYRAIDDRRGGASTLNNLGAVHYGMGDYMAARECYEQAMNTHHAIGNRQGKASSSNNLGLVWCELGDYTTAREHIERSLAIVRAIGNKQNEASSLNNMGAVYHKEARYAAAQAHYEQALVITRAIGDKERTGSTLTYLGMSLEQLGDLDGAEAVYRQASAIHRELGQVAQNVIDVAGLGQVALTRGRMDEAKEYADKCLAHIAAHGVTGVEHIFTVYLACACILEACGERERAQGVIEAAYALLMERADKIADPQQTGAGEALRRSFLENVPAHREVAQEWSKSV